MSTKKIGIVFLPGITVLAAGARTGTSIFAPPCVGIAPAKRSRPLAPTLLSVAGVSTAPGTLSLTIRLPTANTDGSPLAEAELIRMRIYYSSSPGVSGNSPYVEQAPSSFTTFAPGLSGTVYVRVAVQDSHGSWSDLSNELSATVPETPRTEFWAHRLGEDSIFSNNTPNAGWVSWSNVTLFFRGIKYVIANGSTNNRYIYWKLTSPNVFLTSDTVPEIGINDVLIGTNVDGYWHLAIYHPQVSAEFLRVGVLQSRNWGPSGGSFLNLDDGTFKLGGSSNPKLSWDGSTLRVEGNVVVTGGDVPYSYVTGGPPPNADNTAGAIGAGIITAGRIELGSSGSVKAGIDGAGTEDSSIRFWAGATYANRASAPFRVTQGGALVATSATITGGALGGTGVVTITSTGLDVGSSGSIRGGKTDYGSGTGFFLGYSGGTYKLDIGSSSQYLRWDGSALSIVGNITVTGGSVPYSYVTGGPPANADNTATVISGGLITTGRIELGSSGYVKAGIDGAGTSDSDIRFWAGATYANRASAPFRVTQGGALVATSATITGGVLGGNNVVTITSTGLDVGTYGSIRGGKTDYGSGTGFFLGYSGGTYKLDIGSSSQYLRWDGSTLTVTGKIVAGSGSQVSADYVRSGSLIGVPVYGQSSYPQAQLVNDYLRVYYNSSNYTAIYSSSFDQTTPQGQCYIAGNTLQLAWNSSYTAYIRAAAALTLEAGGILKFVTYGNNIVWDPNGTKAFYPLYPCDLGTSAYYWRNIYYKDLYDQGCLGSFDEGLEILDDKGERKRVTPVQALKAIRTKGGEKTHYGREALDYSSFPPECVKPAPIAEKDFVDETGRVYKKGEKIGNDGVSLSALISLLISAIKELDMRLERLEGKAA